MANKDKHLNSLFFSAFFGMLFGALAGALVVYVLEVQDFFEPLIIGVFLGLITGVLLNIL